MNIFVLTEEEIKELEEVSVDTLIKRCLPPIEAILFSKYKELER